MVCNIPTLLTWLRILLIPILVAVFYLPAQSKIFGTTSQETINLAAMLIFLLASVTDWLDGYLARRWNQTSAFGAFLDPVADKLMVAAALIVLVEFERVGAMAALIIIGREIAISALREWMASLGKRNSVGVAMIGKIKTAAQMIAILFLLYWENVQIAGVEIPIKLIGHVLIAVAVFLTLLSMAYYIKAAMPQLRES